MTEQEEGKLKFLPEGMTLGDIEVRDFRKWKLPTQEESEEAFDAFDSDNDGLINTHEMCQALLKYWGVELREHEVESLMTLYDIEGDGLLHLGVCTVQYCSCVHTERRSLLRQYLVVLPTLFFRVCA